MFEKGEIAGEKIVEDNVKLKREIVAIEQKQSTITLKIHILVVRVSFWEDFEDYMEIQAEKLENFVNLEHMGKFPSAAGVIEKLELTKEKLTKQNEEVHSRKGKNLFPQNRFLESVKPTWDEILIALD